MALLLLTLCFFMYVIIGAIFVTLLIKLGHARADEETANLLLIGLFWPALVFAWVGVMLFAAVVGKK